MPPFKIGLIIRKYVVREPRPDSGVTLLEVPAHLLATEDSVSDDDEGESDLPRFTYDDLTDIRPDVRTVDEMVADGMLDDGTVARYRAHWSRFVLVSREAALKGEVPSEEDLQRRWLETA